MSKLFLVLFIIFIPLITSCGNEDNLIEDVQVEDSTKTIYLDCTDENCEEIIIQGDPYQSNPDFYGYADPSIRKDLDSNTVWLSYSFPHYKLLDGKYLPSVAIHLAKSEDSGSSWIFVKKLFEPIKMYNPADGTTEGFLDHETINLIPISRESGSFWCAARLNYFIPMTGGFKARPYDSFHISIVKANTPEDLSSGDVGVIGGSLTHASWNLSATLIPPDLSADYFFWNEPALFYDSDSDKLYLAMVAFVYHGPTPVMSKNNVYIYSTVPNGSPETWEWTYNGVLVNSSIASELGGERITQVDIAKGTDGKLLLIATPDDWNSEQNDFNHKGCKVVEIKSLEVPELERDDKGKIIVRVSITASDTNDLGSGASAYDPNSETGILFTKRAKTSNSLTANIRITGLRP